MSSGTTSGSAFSAGDSALGYLYQTRAALLSSLRRLTREQQFSVYLETLDDVVFETAGSPTELFQFKHHLKSAANLTDASPDIWKSLRVWMAGRSNGSIPDDARLFLATTSPVASGSAASKLLTLERNEAEAAAAFLSIATTSSNETNAASYKLYLQMTEPERIKLLASVVFLPQEPNISSISTRLREHVLLAVRRDFVDSFLSRLEGWWLLRCLNHLTSGSTTPILSDELESHMNELRDQFLSDKLPVDDDILATEISLSDYEQRIFVHQARLAGVNARRVVGAVRDYYRAFEQRSRWIRENLLVVGELERYERTLCEEWELMFAQVADEIGNSEAEAEQRRAAMLMYKWAEDSLYPIRARVTNQSLSRGSLHILADQQRVGWHPQFKERLRQLLEQGQTA